MEHLLDLTEAGIRRLTTFPALIETLLSVTGDHDEADEQRLLKDKARAELAKLETQNDFPLLHSYAIVGMWGALEAMIEDLSISWMEHNPSVLGEPKVAKIRVPFIEFQNLDQQEKLRFLVTELQRDLGAELKGGVTRFESLLGLLGLGGLWIKGSETSFSRPRICATYLPTGEVLPIADLSLIVRIFHIRSAI